MYQIKKLSLLVFICLSLSACGSGKRSFDMRVHSDPLGAYALMQVKYKDDEDSDWIFLGPTPVVINKTIRFKNARTVTLKMIRPGFYEQVKSWNARDFVREHKKLNSISWVPNMVKQ